MKRLTVTFTLALIVVCGASAADWTTVLRGVPPKLGRLELLSSAGKGVCTAIVLNTNEAKVHDVKGAFALTAAHCTATDQGGRLDLTFNGREADVVTANRLLDLAVIRFNPKDEVAITLSPRSAEAGQDVAMVGFAFSRAQLSAQFGHVALPLELASQELWLDGVTIPGDSGGAVLALDGSLLGLISGLRYDATGSAHVGTAVPIDAIRDFVKPYLPRP